MMLTCTRGSTGWEKDRRALTDWVVTDPILTCRPKKNHIVLGYFLFNGDFLHTHHVGGEVGVAVDAAVGVALAEVDALDLRPH